MNIRTIGTAVGLAALLAATSCTQQPSAQQPPASPAAPAPTTPPTGRFQVATVAEGDRGATLVLVDTTTGESWLFHPPQGPLFNGFWGDVPRVTSPGETWRAAFQTLLQPQQPAAPAPAPAAKPAK